VKRLIFSAVWFALIPPLLFAAPESARTPAVNYPLLTGAEVIDAPVAHPPYPASDHRDLIGDTVTVGRTWYDNQHNGTIGRMIVKDEYGWLHFVWMNGLDYGATNRHIYYNVINPEGVQGWPETGYPVESSYRAGYPCLDVGFEGRAFPAFHWTNVPGGDFWTAIATDFFPHSGMFITYETPQIPGVPEVIWPRMQMDWNGYIHVVSTENPESGQAGDPQRHYYTRGTYDPMTYSITYDPWEEMTWTMVMGAEPGQWSWAPTWRRLLYRIGSPSDGCIAGMKAFLCRAGVTAFSTMTSIS
jgi:hypothetical protein